MICQQNFALEAVDGGGEKKLTLSHWTFFTSRSSRATSLKDGWWWDIKLAAYVADAHGDRGPASSPAPPEMPK
jgi:hypothetical protein